MSWRIIKIETSGKLSFQNNQLRYDNYVSQESLFFPTEDIAVLILESLQISLTSALISELSEKSVTIIFCNGKHRPVSVLSPIGKPFRQTETAFLQIGMTQSMCNRLWQRNIRQKILNQSFVLKSVSPETARLLKEISERRTIEENDVAESRAARIYWQNLFSESFVRHHEDATNVPTEPLNSRNFHLTPKDRENVLKSRDEIAACMTSPLAYPRIGIEAAWRKVYNLTVERKQTRQTKENEREIEI